jgi:hypothetical protein
MKDGKAVAAGGIIDGEVRVIPTTTGMHLYAFATGGDLSLTTVSTVRDAGGRYLAVLSRHRAVDAQLQAEQLYGYCTGSPRNADE